MSKLSASLRDSIIAEKHNVEDKANIKPVKGKTKQLNKTSKFSSVKEITLPKKQHSAVGSKPVLIAAHSEHTLLEALKDKLANKNLPSGLYYEILLLLLKANLVNRQLECVVKMSEQITDNASNYINIPVQNIEKTTRLNLAMVREIVQDASEAVRGLTTADNIYEILDCLKQVAIRNVDRNTSYWEDLSATTATMRGQFREAMQNQYKQVQANLANTLSGYGVFSPFATSILQLLNKNG